MMFNKLGQTERTSRFWRFDESEDANDGPVALVRELSAVVWLHKYKLLACTIAGLTIAGLYAHSLPRTYVSTATLLLEPRQTAIPGQDAGPLQSLDLNRADSELQIISSERLLSLVFESLGLQHSPELGPQPPSMLGSILMSAKQALGIATPTAPGEGLSGMDNSSGPPSKEEVQRQAAFSNFGKHLSVRRVGQSYVIEIQYTSIDPAIPARVANAAVSGYIMQAVSFKAEAVRARSEALQGRLDALGAQVDAASDAMRRGQLPTIATPDADARIIGAALPPLTPSGPRGLLITLLGGILGLMAGSSLIALNFARDRRIVSVDELTREAGIPCLGLIPGVSEDRVAFAFDLQKDYVNSIRDLRTSIEIGCAALRTERGIVIALVGWNESKQVSALCVSLAQLIRGGSRHVTLFQSADWYDDHGAEDRAPGLTSLADASLSDLEGNRHVFNNFRGVMTVPIQSSGATANLFADFRHPRVAKLLDAARDGGDVLLDLPPLENSKDALALATHADVVLFVATFGKTTVGQVNSALQQLRRARAKLIGTVITEVAA